MKEDRFEVADKLGNNCAVMCGECGKSFIVSGFVNKSPRMCPHCGKVRVSYDEAAEAWDQVQHEAVVNPEQNYFHMIFKKDWMGHDVWVTFSDEETGETYRYPHDQILQILINRDGEVEKTRNWQLHGVCHYPRLSEAKQKLLERYIVT